MVYNYVRKYSDNDILHWHTRTFKRCTPFMQIMKLEEEIKELEKDSGEEEIADVYICLVSLQYRYKLQLAKYLKRIIMNTYIDKTDLFKIIDKKMEENVKRKWDENMHHKDNK